MRLRIAVCGIHGASGDAFQVSHLEAIVPVFPNLRDAVAALGSGNPTGNGSAWSASPTSKPSDGRDCRGPAWPYRRVAATIFVLLAVTFLVWRLASGTHDADYVSQTVWHLASPGTIEGEVRIVHGGDSSPDAGCAIVAWPADPVSSLEQSQDPARRVIGRDESRRRTTITGPFFTQTHAQGNYRSPVRSPDMSPRNTTSCSVSPSEPNPPALHPD